MSDDHGELLVFHIIPKERYSCFVPPDVQKEIKDKSGAYIAQFTSEKQKVICFITTSSTNIAKVSVYKIDGRIFLGEKVVLLDELKDNSNAKAGKGQTLKSE